MPAWRGWSRGKGRGLRRTGRGRKRRCLRNGRGGAEVEKTRTKNGDWRAGGDGGRSVRRWGGREGGETCWWWLSGTPAKQK